MKFKESIKLQSRSMLDSFSLSSDELRLLQALGFGFSQLGSAVAMEATYNPSNIEAIRSFVASHAVNAEIRHSIWPEFDDEDYIKAKLWVLLFPEVWIDGIDFRVQCDKCGAKRTVVDPTIKVPSIEAKSKPVVTVNGQFTIIREDISKTIQTNLTGATFAPFDVAGKYLYFLSSRRLSPISVHRNEIIGIHGTCDACNSPKCDMYFGPLRFPSASWNGDDIVFAEFRDANVYTPKAAEVFSKLERKTVRDGVVLFD